MIGCIATVTQQVDKTELVKMMSCACGNLRSTARAVTQLFDDTFQPLGIRSTQFGLLAAIAYMDTVTVTTMADFFGMDRTTLTRNLKPLQRDGLLVIREGEDRRTREVSLTTRGKSVVADGLALWNQAQKCVVDAFGADRFQSLLLDLNDLSAVVRENSIKEDRVEAPASKII